MKLLDRLARSFADDLSDLVNRTVTTGTRFSAVIPRPGTCVVGIGVTPKRWDTPRVFPLKLRAGAPSGYMFVAYTLGLDDNEERRLTVTTSTVAFRAAPERRQTLVHYDREPDNAYPNPHVQVIGESAVLADIGGRNPNAKPELSDIHFPVGDRRFRPTLEDVIEMLVVEGFAAAHPGWRDAVERHRHKWREVQVKATAHEHPDWVAEALRAQGWSVMPPAETLLAGA
jgi:hypothetical protein